VVAARACVRLAQLAARLSGRDLDSVRLGIALFELALGTNAREEATEALSDAFQIAFDW